MKYIFLLVMIPFGLFSQTLQLHYDLRKTVDPGHNSFNYPTIYFEYWKGDDSSSILVKLQADLNDEKRNMGKSYLQVSKSFRLYKKVMVNLSYSGGLGLTTPREYSFTIINTFQAGLSYALQWKHAYLNPVLDIKYIPYRKPSVDPIFTLYWWKGLHNYTVEFSGDLSVWTVNKNQGNDASGSVSGKRFAFLGEPQIWVKLHRQIFLGGRLNMFYNVLDADGRFEVYPTIGVRVKV